MLRLIVTEGPASGREFELGRSGGIIGRHREAEVSLDGANVSRRHARVLAEAKRLYLEDLGSSNGTYLNRARVAGRAELKPDDEIRIGSHVLRVRLSGPEKPQVRIRAETAALTSNQELFRHRAAEKLQAVLELAHHLANSLDLDVLLARLLDQLVVLFPQSERAMVLTRQGAGFGVRAYRTRKGMPGEAPVFSRSIIERVAEQGVGVVAEDISTGSTPITAQTLVSLGIRSFICVPLKARSHQVMGALQLDRQSQGHPFTQEDLYLLAAIALQVSTVLENAQLHHELVAKERLDREMALAREIQEGFLPGGFEPGHSPSEAMELSARVYPALEVAGDFYDYFPLQPGSLLFVVADVSGKGMPAALFMVMVRTLLRRADGQVVPLEGKPGPLLGFGSGKPVLPEAEVQLAPGEALVFYTDGVTEAMRAGEGPMFGVERFTQALSVRRADEPLHCWSESILEAVVRFSEQGLQDDLTLLFLRRRGGGS